MARSKVQVETAATKRQRTVKARSGEEPGRVRLPGKARQLGDIRKQTVTARESLVGAFDKLGGVAGLVKWGKDNPTEFYRIWARLVPREVEFGATASLEDLLARLAEHDATTPTPQPGDNAVVVEGTVVARHG